MHESKFTVQTALHLRLLLGLARRQTEGLLQPLVELVGLDIEVADASALHNVLSRTKGKIDRFTADGASDRREGNDAAGRQGAYVVIPSQRGAVVSGDPVPRTRDRHVRRIAGYPT